MRAARQRLARAAALVMLAAPVAWACGPFFGERLLIDRAATLRHAPRARIEEVIRQMHLGAPALAASWAGPDLSGEAYRKQTREVDQAELALALGRHPEAGKVLERYAALRAELEALQATPPANASGGRQPGPPRLPPGLPPEFGDYLEGAFARARGDAAGARAAWERLLARPAAERRFRSTWAAFMLGRQLHGQDSAAAAARYRQTRELSQQGFRDPLGLGAASVGHEAQLALEAGRYADAARLYLESCALEDPAGATSLQFFSWRLLAADEATRAAALRDAGVRRVVVAHLVSSRETREARADSTTGRLLAMLLASTRGERDVEGADQLAWIAYQRNDPAGADAWLERARPDAPLGAWLRSKQLARRGKLAEAARELGRASAAFPLAAGEPQDLDSQDEFGPPELARRVRAELGVVQLSRGQFVESLDLLLRSGHWRDAAHVAERVLTADELRAYVDRSWPASASYAVAPASGAAPTPTDEVGAPPLGATDRLRYLLGRRLARLDRWGEARAYLPGALRPHADLYIAARAAARGPDTLDRRVAALWLMARLERHKGIELIGTEIGPDWAVDDGNFDESTYQGKARAALVGADERRREKASAPAYPARFHYRRVAAERAVEAARLLPDGDRRIGEMLCEALGWLSHDAAGAARVRAEARRRRARCP